MKGTPQQPQCGFSRAVIQMLEVEGADFKEVDSHNILENDVMREELKDFSDWPTFPQVYLAGEFYAGCDIMYEDYQNEKLREILLESGLNLPDINPQDN
jgi:monothiol glutaredoxin